MSNQSPQYQQLGQPQYQQLGQPQYQQLGQPQYQQYPPREKKSYSFKIMFLTALIIFSLVVFIWYIWAYTIFRYQSDRVNSKILKRYKIANPDSYKPETEDIKTNDHVYKSDYTQLTANVIIFDKRTRDTIKEQPIKLKISSTCSPILSTCIKL